MDMKGLGVIGSHEHVLSTDRHRELISYEEIQNLAYGLVGHPTRNHHQRTARQLLQTSRAKTGIKLPDGANGSAADIQSPS